MEPEIKSFNKFLDFDSNRHVLYYNIYYNDIKRVVKIPISDCEKEEIANERGDEVRIEKFDLTKYKFLINCDDGKNLQYYS